MRHTRRFGLLLLMCGLVLAGCGQVVRPDFHTEQPAGDATRGQQLFQHGFNGAPPCVTCHAIRPSMRLMVGPNLGGLAQRAASRLEGVAAQAYLRQSILDPNAFVVPGFQGVMYPGYASHYGEQDITDLVAYLLTLS
jgi:sulfur-oxidizing protein SoxX